MYENTNSSIDWKGIILKVIIAFLVVAIAFTGIKTFTKGKVDKKPVTTNVVESNLNVTSNANAEKLLEAGKKYYTENTTKLPKDEIKSIVTLNDLIKAGVITSITDADGKACDGESSYVTAEKSTNQNNENDYTIKANLVCGESYNNVSTYLSENAPKVEINQNIKVDESTGNNKKVDSSKTTNTCGTSCAPASSKITAENKVVINKGNASTNNSSNNNTVSNVNVVKRQYRVSFDGNGGTCNYSGYYVNEGEYAYNPGNCTRRGYVFKGWYLDNRIYNFNTPVTSNITLVAEYSKDNGYYTDDSDSYERIGRDTIETLVYTMGWDSEYTDSITITHTLDVENAIDEIVYNNDIRRSDITRIRIADLEYVEAINTSSEAKIYWNDHASTFLNSASAKVNASNKKTTDSLAYVKSARVDADSYKFVNISQAKRNGFEVTWTSRSISRTCSSPFDLYLEDGSVAYDVCNYGIIYKVTWEYEYEY